MFQTPAPKGRALLGDRRGDVTACRAGAEVGRSGEARRTESTRPEETTLGAAHGSGDHM